MYGILQISNISSRLSYSLIPFVPDPCLRKRSHMASQISSRDKKPASIGTGPDKVQNMKKISDQLGPSGPCIPDSEFRRWTYVGHVELPVAKVIRKIRVAVKIFKIIVNFNFCIYVRTITCNLSQNNWIYRLRRVYEFLISWRGHILSYYLYTTNAWPMYIIEQYVVDQLIIEITILSPTYQRLPLMRLC